MNPTTGLERLFEWLLNRSWQAGVLVLSVLFIQWLFRRQLRNRWRSALWWIVLARLLLPFGPESELSLFNGFRAVGNAVVHPHQSGKTGNALTTMAMVSKTPEARTHAQSVQSPMQIGEITPAPAHTYKTPLNFMSAAPLDHQAPLTKSKADLHWWIWFAGIGSWLAGAITLAACVFWQVSRFTRRLAKSASKADDKSCEILAGCQRELRVRRNIQLLETEAVKSPALFGLFHLRLLLPPGLTARFDHNELRFVFLHELAHVRRGDLWLNWLVTSLQVLHWFNPLLWLGFARLRADRELACDELALQHTGATAAEAYGSTIIKLLEGLQRSTIMPGLVGILEDKQQMRRRISRIAGFRKATRWSALAGLLLLALGLVALTDAEPQAPLAGRPNLTGTVETKTGKPVRATVFIYTAEPKVGTSPFCPSCYADCAKSAKADANGHFEIKSLDPQLIFRILAVAPDCKPKFVSKVDPAKGPVKIRLNPIELAAAPPGNCVHGRVLNQSGKPIVGAVVEQHGIRSRGGGEGWGSIPYVDPLAVTDEKGDFLITSRKPIYEMDVEVKARGYANKIFKKLASGNEVHKLFLTEGAAISGQVLFHGKPLPDVEVGVVPVDRNSESFTGSCAVGTDSHGRFLLANLPPNVNYYIYGLMKPLQPYGAIPAQVIHSGKVGSVTDVGNLAVVPGYRLAGHVVLADGKPVPPKTRLLVGRENAWDSIQVKLPADGRFDLSHVPAGTISLSVRVPSYRVSAKNASLDSMNPWQLIGQVNGDITNLIFLLEKGKRLAPNYDNNLPASEWPQNLPLHGAEFKPNRSHQWAVSGQVTDRQTGRPIAHFHVTPGDENSTRGQFNWDLRDAANGTNGTYTVYVDKRWTQPVLKVEAGGYLPASATVTPLEQTNANFELENGKGPRGTVLEPDGRPARNTSVLLICAASRQPHLDYAGHLNSWPNQGLLVRTDAKGRFAFTPRLKMRSVAAASHLGFGQVPVAELATNPIVRLEPYGEIKGTLERPGGPGTNEILDLAFVGPPNSFNQRVNLPNSSHTDATGHFDFKHVPPGRLQISCQLPVGQNGWQDIPLQQVILKPGQTLELNIKAPAQQVSMPPSKPIPAPVRVPGVELKGSVVLPNGKPAAEIQVGLQVKGQYLALGRALLNSYQELQDGLLVRTDPNGKFTLPMCQGAESVIAVSEDGFARVSLAELKHSPQITLQPWGGIEGTLLVNHRPGTNEILTLSGPPPTWSRFTIRKAGQATNELTLTNSISPPPQPLIYDFSTFQTRTDDRGRFVMTYVPPGKQTILLMMPQGPGSWMDRPVDMANVEPGKVTQVSLNLTGRTVIGRVTLVGTNAPLHWQQGRGEIHQSANFKLIEKLQAAKTQPERMALFRSKAYQRAIRNIRSYPVALSPDGSFKVQGVAPGKYEFNIQFIHPGSLSVPPANITFLRSTKEFIVSEGVRTNSDVLVNWGIVKLKPITLPVFTDVKTNVDKRAGR